MGIWENVSVKVDRRWKIRLYVKVFMDYGLIEGVYYCDLLWWFYYKMSKKLMKWKGGSNGW